MTRREELQAEITRAMADHIATLADPIPFDYIDLTQFYGPTLNKMMANHIVPLVDPRPFDYSDIRIAYAPESAPIVPDIITPIDRPADCRCEFNVKYHGASAVVCWPCQDAGYTTLGVGDAKYSLPKRRLKW